MTQQEETKIDEENQAVEDLEMRTNDENTKEGKEEKPPNSDTEEADEKKTEAVDEENMEAGEAPKPEPRFPFPKSFFDPITKKIMMEPVVHPNGDSYEKKDALERDSEVVYYPNRALQTFIEQEIDRFGDAGSMRGAVQQWGENFKSGWHKLLEKTALPAGEYRPLPDSFYCPISLSLIHEPVIDCDGHTYEKAAIMQWIQANGDSPVTRKQLTIESLYDNMALLSALQELAEEAEVEAIQPSVRRWKEEHANHQPWVAPIPVPTANSTTSPSIPTITPEQHYATSHQELMELRRLQSQRNITMCSILVFFLAVVLFLPSYLACFLIICVLVWVLTAPCRVRSRERRREIIQNAIARQQQQQQQDRR